LAAGEAPAIGASSVVDQKSIPMSGKALQIAKTAMRKAGGKRKGAYLRTKLFTNTPATSSAGTAFALTKPLRPTDSSEYTAFSGLFDEVRVLAVKVWHSYNVAASANLPISLLGAIGYDSTYFTTPSSVTDVMESTQMKPFCLAVSPTGTASGAFPASVASSGLWEFNIEIPKESVANAAAVTGGTGITPNFPGEWMAISDSSDSVGYLRIYVNNPGTTGAVSANILMQYDVEFRERT